MSSDESSPALSPCDSLDEDLKAFKREASRQEEEVIEPEPTENKGKDKNQFLVEFDPNDYKKTRIAANPVAMSENECFNSLGIQLPHLGETHNTWHLIHGTGIRFFMNEGGNKASVHLPRAHVSMYLLSLIRMKGYKDNYDKGDDFPQRAQTPSYAQALQVLCNTFTSRMDPDDPDEPEDIEVNNNDQAASLFKKILNGYNTYTKINLQLSRLAARFAASRLGYEGGLFATEMDALRTIICSECTTKIMPESLGDRKVTFLASLLCEWLSYHKFKVEEDPEDLDYTRWPPRDTTDYIFEKKPDSVEETPKTSRKKAKKATTSHLRARASLSGALLQPVTKSSSKTTNYHATHYLVEARDERVKELTKLLLRHAQLEHTYSVEESNNTQRLKVAQRVALAIPAIASWHEKKLASKAAGEEKASASTASAISSPAASTITGASPAVTTKSPDASSKSAETTRRTSKRTRDTTQSPTTPSAKKRAADKDDSSKEEDETYRQPTSPPSDDEVDDTGN